MIIRKLQKEDLPLRVEWMNHPKVYSSMHFEIPILMENTLQWYHRIKDDLSRSDVVFIRDEKVMAFGGLTSITSNKDGMAELYVFVDPNEQHNGCGTLATRLLCDWGFNKIGLHKIYLYTNEDNLPAIKVYKKCGFILEGKHRQEYLDGAGLYKDRLYFGLLKSEWEKL